MLQYLYLHMAFNLFEKGNDNFVCNLVCGWAPMIKSDLIFLLPFLDRSKSIQVHRALLQQLENYILEVL